MYISYVFNFKLVLIYALISRILGYINYNLKQCVNKILISTPSSLNINLIEQFSKNFREKKFNEII